MEQLGGCREQSREHEARVEIVGIDSADGRDSCSKENEEEDEVSEGQEQAKKDEAQRMTTLPSLRKRRPAAARPPSPKQSRQRAFLTSQKSRTPRRARKWKTGVRLGSCGRVYDTSAGADYPSPGLPLLSLEVERPCLPHRVENLMDVEMILSWSRWSAPSAI